MRLLAPVLPMLTETCYQNLVRSERPDAPESVHLTAYPMVNTALFDDELVEQMDNVSRLHQLALSAREKSRLKLRQPLARLLIAPATPQERSAVQRFAALLQNGLNVKQIEVLDVNTPCPMERRLKPNYRTLGQRFKSRAKTVADVVEQHADQLVQAMQQGVDTFELDVQGTSVMLTADDLLVEEVEPQTLALARFERGWLAFDTHLTDELRQEGVMRDVLRQLQVLRKEIGLEIEDRIQIGYHTKSSVLKTVFEVYGPFLCAELLCDHFTETSVTTGKQISISGETINFTLEKA